MKTDTQTQETRERLIESAVAEFSENGYAMASLRRICADAGVTTGALYFFFRDKEDLFAAIVEQPFNELKKLLRANLKAENELPPSELSAALIHHLYSNYDAFVLLFTKAQGTWFEGAVGELADAVDKAYRKLAKSIAAQTPGKRVNSPMLHWLSHAIADAFVHLLTHEPSEKKAVKTMTRIMNFYVSSRVDLVIEDI